MHNQEAYNQLLAEWQNKYGDGLIKIGPMDWGKYTNTKPRLLWILNNAIYVLDLIEYHAQKSKGKAHYKRGHESYELVVKTSYGILNGITDWKTSNNIAVDNMADVLQSIAIIVINKEDKKSGSKSGYKGKLMQASAEEMWEFIEEQMQYLSPDIVICGGTAGLLNLLPEWKHGDVETWTTLTLIAAEDPSQTKFTHERYYNGILNSSKFGELIQAIHRNDMERMKYLLAIGTDINAADCYGVTALMEAAQQAKFAYLCSQKYCSTSVQISLPASLNIVKFLLDHGADIYAQNGEGFTALSYAHQCPDIVDLLKKHGQKISSIKRR